MTNAGCARSMHLQTSPPESTWRTNYCDPLREKIQCVSGEKSQLGMTTSSPQLSHDDLFTRFPWQAGQIVSPITFEQTARSEEHTSKLPAIMSKSHDHFVVNQTLNRNYQE